MLCLAGLFILISTELSTAIAAQEIDWAVGAELQRQTLVSNTGQWLDAPLRPLLMQLSETRRIPIFIDRRVDPSAPVTLAAKDLTWDQLLYEIGRPHGYGFCRLEGIYYFGPVETAMTLPANFEKLNGWIKENRRNAKVNWRRPARARWHQLTQPRELFVRALEPLNVEVLELDSIPFDLWPAADVNQLPINLQVALIAVGFEKWITVTRSGKKVKVVPYPDTSAMIELCNIENIDSALDKLRSGNKNIRISKRDKSSMLISGPTNQVYNAMKDALKFQVAKKGDVQESTFTAELKGKRGSIVATMAQQMDLRMEFDPGLGGALSEHIEFDVKDATVDAILEQALKGTGIQFRIEATKLKLFRK